MTHTRAGFGFDVHAYTDRGRDILLAQVKIPYERTLSAVSDGDVVLHAICDALCGACGLGDIGDLFPPEAESSQNVSSAEIVRFVLGKMEGRFSLINIDVTIVAQAPRLVPYKEAMCGQLKKLFSCPVNVKIKSKEGLSLLGGKDAVCCMAVASVKSDENL
ncbi:MAG: 2-C-methyl-D-erythritol 2,4-cyclodiphosphate synthase [Candidatus Omnitrophica bacterium]|nr:2-C-methyl-D-erythritol 2,4-cyclodiphosphate synthase [Candidatus Omnitrophota bacterium]